MPPASIWAKTGTTVAFARRAVAAAGAVAGVERRGARSGAPFDVQHSRRAEREQWLEPALRRFWPLPCVGRPALDPLIVSAPGCAHSAGARARWPGASRCGTVAIAVRKAVPPSLGAGDGESLAAALGQLALDYKRPASTPVTHRWRGDGRAAAGGAATAPADGSAGFWRFGRFFFPAEPPIQALRRHEKLSSARSASDIEGQGLVLNNTCM